MELTVKDIKKSVDDFFDIATTHLKNNIINAFIPLGGIAELPNKQVLTFAFEHEIQELIDYLRENLELLPQFDNNSKQKTRIILQMYCRIIENDFQYLIIYNILRLLNDLYPDWEFKVERNSKPFYCESPTSKIDEICSLCKITNLKIGIILKNILKADLRNSYYHSQYTLSPDGTFVNTRFYSPVSQIKPAKKCYNLNEIQALYKFAEYFFDVFFERFYFEIKKFRDGKKYNFSEKENIYWNERNKRWVLLKKIKNA